MTSEITSVVLMAFLFSQCKMLKRDLTSRHFLVSKLPSETMSDKPTIYDETYPSRRLLGVIGDKWKPIVPLHSRQGHEAVWPVATLPA